MAIKGLTTRDALTPRFPRIGKLRKGDEHATKTKANGDSYDTYGKDLEYFRFTSDDPAVLQIFHEHIGDEPRQINVYLPYKTLEENFQTWNEQWTASGLVHRCDGERTVSFLKDPVKGVYETDPDKQKPCPGGCESVGRLEVIIPELLQAGYVGTVTMETGSIHDLINISQTLLKTEEFRNGHPLGLRGILFVLRRVPERISTPGFGKNADKRQRVKKWLVRIDPAPEWVALQQHVGENVLEETEERLQLTDGNDIYDPISGELVEVPERARLSGEQVQAAVMGARAVAAAKATTPEQRRAEADERRRQREIDDHAFDMPPMEGAFRPVVEPSDVLAVDSDEEWHELIQDAQTPAEPQPALIPDQEPKAEQPKVSGTNGGKLYPASIEPGAVAIFGAKAADFAAKHPAYRMKLTTDPDRYHILMSVRKCGHGKVNVDNIEQVFAELEDRALLNEATTPQPAQ